LQDNNGFVISFEDNTIFCKHDKLLLKTLLDVIVYGSPESVTKFL
jgi:hypothetical protein